MELTAKQLAFATKVVQGLGKSDAYRAVYDCKASNDQTVASRASGLMSHAGVAAKIQQMRGAATGAAARKVGYTLADAITEADQLRLMAEEKGLLAAAIAASTLKSKLAGHLIERKEIKAGPLDEADVDELQALLAALRLRSAGEAGGAEPPPGNRPEVRALH